MSVDAHLGESGGPADARPTTVEEALPLVQAGHAAVVITVNEGERDPDDPTLLVYRDDANGVIQSRSIGGWSEGVTEAVCDIGAPFLEQFLTGRFEHGPPGAPRTLALVAMPERSHVLSEPKVAAADRAILDKLEQDSRRYGHAVQAGRHMFGAVDQLTAAREQWMAADRQDLVDECQTLVEKLVELHVRERKRREQGLVS